MSRAQEVLRALIPGALVSLALGCEVTDRTSTEGPQASYAAPQPPPLRLEDAFPNVLLYTQDNKPVRFYDDLIKEKIVLINMMYTKCSGI